MDEEDEAMLHMELPAMPAANADPLLVADPWAQGERPEKAHRTGVGKGSADIGPVATVPASSKGSCQHHPALGTVGGSPYVTKEEHKDGLSALGSKL
eukprot:771026-Karenia_brevis.AAC.1